MNNINPEKQLARDKIAQVYLGEWGSEAFQKRSRNRIQWFVDQITQGTVLDIGCSEGILPILLGRKGVEVIGIDVNPDAIEYAKEMLVKEQPEVSNRVTFLCADVLTHDWQDRKFDVVILGEIIEHFAQPAEPIDKAFSLLQPGGTLLVTTPFGILPDPDHRFTFTLSTFLTYFRKFSLTPISLTVVDSYIRFAARKDAGKGNEWHQIDENLLSLTEAGLLDEQRNLRDLIDEMSVQRKELYGTISDLRQEQAKLTTTLKELDSKHNDLQIKFGQLEVSYQEVEQEKNTLVNQLQNSAADCQKQEQAIATLEQRYQRLEQKYTELLTIHDALTHSFSYEVTQEISSSLKPLRLSSLLLPASLVKLILQHNKRHASAH